MDLFFSVVVLVVYQAAELCYKGMVVVFGIWLAVQWGII